MTPQVAITMDLSASILAAAGAEVPAETRLEGIDLLPILSGRTKPVERNLFWRTQAGNRNQKAVRSGNWKLLIDGTHAEVYDLAKDPAERNDLSATRTDVAARLWGLLKEWEASVDEEAKALAR